MAPRFTRWSLDRIGRKARRRRAAGDLIAEALAGPSEELASALAQRAHQAPELAIALARVRLRLGDASGADIALDEALSRWPRHRGLLAERAAVARERWASVRRGWYLHRIGEYDPAAAAFRDALADVGRTTPMEALGGIVCGLGWCTLNAGRAVEALAHFERAARVEPESFDAHFGMGLSHRALGDERRARPRLARAVRFSADRAPALAWIGWCHYEAARWGPAERAFAAALAANPVDLEALWGAAWTAWRRDDAGGAGERFRRALDRGWHTSTPDLVALIETDVAWRALAEPAAHCAFDAERLDETRRLAPLLAPRDAAEFTARIAEREGRWSDLATLPETPGGDTPRTNALRARAAAGMGDVTSALRSARRVGPGLEGEILEGAGRPDEALEAWLRARDDGDPRAPSHVARLRRIVRRATLLQRTGDRVMPRVPADAARNLLAATLADEAPPDAVPRGDHGLAARLVDRVRRRGAPSRRDVRAARRLLLRAEDDEILHNAVREILVAAEYGTGDDEIDRS